MRKRAVYLSVPVGADRVQFFFAQIGQHFLAVNAAEFVSRVGFALLAAFTERSPERAAAYVPKFGYLNPGRINLEGSSHRAEKDCSALAGPENERILVLEGVDGVYDVVVTAEIELFVVLVAIVAANCLDACIGIDCEQSFFHNFGLWLSDVELGRHQLAVDIA